jgi:hypothetical protein
VAQREAGQAGPAALPMRQGSAGQWQQAAAVATGEAAGQWQQQWRLARRQSSGAAGEAVRQWPAGSWPRRPTSVKKRRKPSPALSLCAAFYALDLFLHDMVSFRL